MAVKLRAGERARGQAVVAARDVGRGEPATGPDWVGGVKRSPNLRKIEICCERN